MNLKQLTYFIAVAEELHFGRAAERLNIAQPPLSRQIRQLEQTLGATLFDRCRNTTRLTQAGERLLERARVILAEIDDTCHEVRRLGQGAEGRLRLGFVGSATYGILPAIVQRYRAAFPDVDLSLMPMNNDQLQSALTARDIDVAFSRPALRDGDFVVHRLVEEELIAALPVTWEMGHPPELDLSVLDRTSLLLYPEFPRPSYADTVLAALDARGIDTSHRVWTMDIQTALSLVAIGEGLCIVPASVGSSFRNGVAFRPVRPGLGTTTLALNHRLDERGTHLHNFVRIAQRVARHEVRAAA
ncbi:LysR family transcriptional regulator [Pseudooceanicola sp. CBS1P-1]|uniref:LysR family transcriptional regulator n=1 Tax=Pseudooceanicola albus TaxID=2692189 RepID=A0A6L7G564_9RHOB|nr:MULTISPECIES: LysR family transcriptional regulator [Pseudooceanicola]MBT9385329.1 LysR family transcriptional regulator [Pseudooceanicola endophyticus]MXN18812.1 LysR family transcriptional regulator [Pseudooceanicola albus]